MHENRDSLSYALKSGIAGGIAGCAAKTVVAPLDRIKILFQTSHKSYIPYQGSLKGFVEAIVELKRTAGIKGLFKGHSATLMRIFPYAGIKFMAYEQFKIVVEKVPASKGIRNFLAGSLAGCTAVFVTYPLDIIRVRLAFDTQAGTLRNTVATIFHEDNPFVKGRGAIVGLANFYRGFIPTILGMVPYAGVSFYTYELLKFRLAKFDFLKSNNEKLLPLVTLSSGAIAGIFAQTCSYPFEVVRRHMQVASQTFYSKTHTTMLSTARDIVTRRGVKGLFVGLGIGFIKVIPLHAVSFYTYEEAKLFLGI